MSCVEIVLSFGKITGDATVSQLAQSNMKRVPLYQSCSAIERVLSAPQKQLLSKIDNMIDDADRLFLKGKVAELRLELNSGGKKDKNHSAKKIALKKVVANMTMSNNDMVALFPDVVGCMNIPSLEIKKMLVAILNSFTKQLTCIDRCFLFLVNYARTKPEVAMKALPVLVLVGHGF